MQYWLDTVDTIPPGVGFAHFGTAHLVWLAAIVLFIWFSAMIYRKLPDGKRKAMRFIFAALIVADEIFKMVMLTIGHRYLPQYLPFHLCSINIFVIALHAVRPSKALDNFLYTVCIPAALAALLFPSWTELPLINFMCIHSFTIHALLIAYPAMLFLGGDIRPSYKQIGQCVLILFGLVAVALCVNLIFDTNFMFIMEAEPGTPLVWFDQHWGNHLLGFPVMIAAVLLVMHGPLCLLQHKKRQTV